MLLWRSYLHGLNVEGIDLYLYTDGSPQWRGVELIASTLDIRVPGQGGVFRQRRLLPAVSINLPMFGPIGKTMALLWQLFLMAGPTYTKMRRILKRVRAMTLDFGTESGMVDVRDILPAFFRFIGAPLPRNYEVQDHLFPVAILQPGLRHSMDYESSSIWRGRAPKTLFFAPG